MRKAILGAASALALASPAVAADLPVTRYSEIPSYEREVLPYEYRTAPPVVVEDPLLGLKRKWFGTGTEVRGSTRLGHHFTDPSSNWT
jgi:opacity protein-like surface antigen